MPEYTIDGVIVPRIRTVNGVRAQPVRASQWNRHPRGVRRGLANIPEIGHVGQAKCIPVCAQHGARTPTRVKYEPIAGEVVSSAGNVSGTSINAALPNGSITRAHLVALIQPPAPQAADAGKLLQVNAAGTAYTLVEAP